MDSNHQTPLYYAAREGHVETCQLLLDVGANTDIVDSNG